MIISEKPIYSISELENEEWKCFHIVNYPQKYYKRGTLLYVSNLGRCRADEKIIEPNPKKNGYLYFHNEPLHRIVYKMFIDKNIYGLDIDHIDRNRQNNRVENLRCCTRKQNMHNENTKIHLIKEFNKPEYITKIKEANIGRLWINNGTKRKKLFPKDCEKYICDGWKYGYKL